MDRNLFSGVEAVCFDLFHTLVDVGSVPASVGGYTADILGLDRSAWNGACFSGAHDICRTTTQLEVIRKMAHHLDPQIPMGLIEEASAARQRRFDYSLKQVDGEIVAALARLQAAGLPLALVSNASTAEVAAWSDSPLAVLFDVALFSCECGHAKPDAQIYHLASERLGVAAAQCLFVGDGGSDEHRGAAAVGMRPVLTTQYLGRSYTAEAVEQRRQLVDYEVASVAELPGLLLSA